MLFNSYIFILLFLPLTMILYYGLNYVGKEKLAKWALIIASLIFYGYFNVGYLPVILASICFNYGFSKVLLNSKYEKYKRSILGAGISCNVGLLLYIKYRNFFLENVNILLGTSFEMEQLLLPLGISFFTFQQIAYLVDSFREETRDYELAVSLMPEIPNIYVFAYADRMDITGNLDNYMDILHYGDWIYEEIMNMIYCGEGELTKENYRGYFQRVRELYSNNK